MALVQESARSRLATRLLEEGRIDSAIEQLVSWAKAEAGDPQLAGRLRRAIDSVEDEEKRIALYETILARGGNIEGFQAILDRLKKQKNRRLLNLDESELAAEFRKQPDADDILARLLRMAGQRNDEKARLEYLKIRVQAQPAPETVLLQLVNTLLDSGDLAGAVQYASMLASAGPVDVRVWNRLAKAAAAAQQPGVEQAALEQILLADPQNSKVRVRLVTMLEDRGQLNEAVPHLAALCDEEPENPKRWNRLLDVLHAIGDVETEIAVLQRMVELEDLRARENVRA